MKTIQKLTSKTEFGFDVIEMLVDNMLPTHIVTSLGLTWPGRFSSAPLKTPIHSNSPINSAILI